MNHRLPDVLFIGPAKTGSSSLHDQVKQHPDTQHGFLITEDRNVQKELHFFDNQKNFNMGMEWYKMRFPYNNKLLFESTPTYINTKECLKRIITNIPNIKLIINLRNPLDRIISFHCHFRSLYMMKSDEFYFNKAKKIAQEVPELKNKIENKLKWISSKNSIGCQYTMNEIINQHRNGIKYQEFKKIVNSSKYFDPSIYIDRIKWLHENHDPEKIHLINFENYLNHNDSTMRSLFEFMGIKYYETKLKHFQSGMDWRMIYDAKEEISQDHIDYIKEYFYPLNRELEKYIGVDLKWND